MWAFNQFRYSGHTFNGRSTFFCLSSRREYNSSRSALLKLITTVTTLKHSLTSNKDPKILQGSLLYVAHLIQVRETCGDNPRSGSQQWQPEGSDIRATSCLLHSACRGLQHVNTLSVTCVSAKQMRSNNNNRYVSVTIGKHRTFIREWRLPCHFILLCEIRSAVCNLR